MVGLQGDAVPPQRGPLARRPSTVTGGQSAEPIDDTLPGDALSSGVRDPPDFARSVGPSRQTRQLSVRHDAAPRDGANDRVDAVHKRLPLRAPWAQDLSRLGGHVRAQALAPERVDAYAAHNRRMGQLGQRGARAVHTVAPKSIRAWLKLYASWEGSNAADSAQICRSDGLRRPQKIRRSTRRTLVSTIGSARP